MEDWVAAQEIEMQLIIAERKKRKKEKLAARKAKKMAEMASLATPIQKMKKYRYDPSTGKRIEVLSWNPSSSPKPSTHRL